MNPVIQVSVLLVLFFNSGCVNVFSPVDSPSSSTQKLEAARACFDQGDFECARDYYNEVISDASADKETAIAERAYIALDQAGAGMGAFVKAFGDGTGGSGLTKLANAMVPYASSTQRNAIFASYRETLSISDSASRGFLRFVTAIALAAEILAEGAGSDGVFSAADLTNSSSDATTCKATSSTTCATDATCNSDGGVPNSTPLTTITDLTTTSAVTASGYLSVASLAQVISQVSTALTEMSATGKFRSGTGNFSSSILSLLSAAGLGTSGVNTSAGPRCVIRELLAQGVGY